MRRDWDDDYRGAERGSILHHRPSVLDRICSAVAFLGHASFSALAIRINYTRNHRVMYLEHELVRDCVSLSSISPDFVRACRRSAGDRGRYGGYDDDRRGPREEWRGNRYGDRYDDRDRYGACAASRRLGARSCAVSCFQGRQRLRRWPSPSQATAAATATGETSTAAGSATGGAARMAMVRPRPRPAAPSRSGAARSTALSVLQQLAAGGSGLPSAFAGGAEPDGCLLPPAARHRGLLARAPLRQPGRLRRPRRRPL